MRLRARVRAVTGATSHGQGAVEGDLVVRGRRLDAPCWIEIQRGEDGYFLLYLDAAQQCITDTWHASVEDAKAQAAFEFATEEQEWEVLST